MAVDIAEIAVVYEALMGNASNTLTKQFDAGYIKGHDYATVLSQVMTSAMQLATSATLDKPFKDAQVALINEQISASISETGVKEAMKDAQVLDMKVKDYALLANTQKDIELKDMEIAKASKDALFIDAKINSLGIEDAIKQAQSTADVATKGAQLTLIKAQTSGENAKTLLTGRQKEYYNDQKMLKVLDSAANALGMYAAGDTSIPAGLENAFANRITTELA